MSDQICIHGVHIRSYCEQCERDEAERAKLIGSSELVRLLREMQKGLTDDARKNLWYEITEGYCRDCGRPDPNHR